MPMEIDRKQLKQRAKESMSLSNPSFWLVTLVYLLMTTGVSFLSDFAPGMLATFISLALTFYCWVVGFSYRLWSLWTARRLEPGLGSLMDGFSVAGRVMMLELSILVRTVGWCFLLMIPVIMLITGMLTVSLSPMAVLVLYFVLIAAVSLGVSAIALRYSMSYYVLADYPDLGPAVAIAHSVRLTKGWILELVKLHLSFAGWYILSAVMALIGMTVGMVLTGGMLAVMALPADQMLAQVAAMDITTTAMLLANLISLPVTLYFTPYLEVTLAHFYDARIHLADNMADPMAGMQMPPV